MAVSTRTSTAFDAIALREGLYEKFAGSSKEASNMLSASSTVSPCRDA